MSYADGRVEYTAASGDGIEYLRVKFLPTSVTVAGAAIPERADLNAEGYTLRSLGGGDYALAIRRTGAAATAATVVIDSTLAPSVAIPASAAPSPVSGATTNLSVLGADDGGENNLSYTWSVVSKPVAATDPSFSLNGTNAAKNSTATFTQAGDYTIRATITNQSGLSTASEVDVTVVSTPITLSVAPSGSLLTVSGTDQFDNALTASAPFTWPAAGVTLQRGGDYLHLYQTGTTTDLASATLATNLQSIAITGLNGADETLTIDLSAGDLLMQTGGVISFDGGAPGTGGGNTLLVRGTAGSDNLTLDAAQFALDSLTPVAYVNVKYFGFDLDTGTNNLLIDHAIVTLDRDHAISAGTEVTVDGGTLDYNGHADAIGDLLVKNNGQVIGTTLNNSATTVESGMLTAASIDCDTLTIGIPVVPTTRTWIGGGSDNKWSTPENWAGGVAPVPGDHLIFPAGAARLENVNDYPPGTIFGSITLSDENYLVQNGAISSAAVQVSSGTLTITSIICDTLTIGSSPGAATGVVAANTANETAAQTDIGRQIVTNDLSRPSVISNAAVVTTSIDSRTIAAQSKGASTYANPATLIPLAADASFVVSSALPIIRQTTSMPETVSAVSPPAHGERQNDKTAIAGSLSLELLADAPFANLSLRSRFDDLHSISNLFLAAERLKDSVYGEISDSMLPHDQQPSLASTASPSAHSQALQSLAKDYRHAYAIEPEVSALLIDKHFRREEKLVKKAVEDFLAESAVAID